MSSAADTSVVIAAVLADHRAHEIASAALAACTSTISHVAVESYSVLTRLPPPHRADPHLAASVLSARLPRMWLALDAEGHAAAPSRLAAAGVSGGSSYDGLIALTALAHDLELLTRDRRAQRAYRSLGVRFQLVT